MLEAGTGADAPLGSQAQGRKMSFASDGSLRKTLHVPGGFGGKSCAK